MVMGTQRVNDLVYMYLRSRPARPAKVPHYCGHFTQVPGQSVLKSDLKKNEFIWVHSLTKTKFSKMCRLQMCLICIFKVAAIGTVSNVKIRHNLTNHHIKTNNGSTLRFSGTGNSFVPVLL